MKVGTLAWWSRLGTEGPFETLVKVAGEPNEFGGVKVNFLVPYQKGAPPVVVERDSNLRYLRAFVPGDERIWDRLGPHPGQRSYTTVKVMRIEEESGLLICTCGRCPHNFDEKVISHHRVLPRFIKNPTDLAMKSMPPTTVAVQLPAQKSPENAIYQRMVEVLKQVVLALAKDEKPQLEDIDFLEGKLGIGLAYTIPTHVTH